MTEDELVRILQKAIETAPIGEKAISVVMFGIRYTDELSRVSVAAVCKAAGIPGWSEVNKGVMLAKYVTIRGEGVESGVPGDGVGGIGRDD